MSDSLKRIQNRLSLKTNLSRLDLTPRLQPIGCINPGIDGRKVNTVLAGIRSLTPSTHAVRTVEHPVVVSSFGVKFQQRTERLPHYKIFGRFINRIKEVDTNRDTFDLKITSFTGGGQLPSLVSTRPSLLNRETVNALSVMSNYKGMLVYTKSALENAQFSDLQKHARILKTKLKEDDNHIVVIHITSKRSVPVTREILIEEILMGYNVLGIIAGE